MGNAGRNGGEYYTPRPLIKTIIKVVRQKIGGLLENEKEHEPIPLIVEPKRNKEPKREKHRNNPAIGGGPNRLITQVYFFNNR